MKTTVTDIFIVPPHCTTALRNEDYEEFAGRIVYCELSSTTIVKNTVTPQGTRWNPREINLSTKSVIKTGQFLDDPPCSKTNSNINFTKTENKLLSAI